MEFSRTNISCFIIYEIATDSNNENKTLVLTLLSMDFSNQTGPRGGGKPPESRLEAEKIIYGKSQMKKLFYPFP